MPVVATLLLTTVAGCRKEVPPAITGNIDPEHTPTMSTTNVETLISDSGVTRYRITSPLWLVFDEAQTPTWRFPKGLKLEKYDDLLRTIATISADSATYLKRRQLWRLDGNVSIDNVTGEKFRTNQLFWDQRAHTVYSDSFIHIERPDRVLEGYGFDANERLTRYNIRNVAGIFPVPKRGASAAAPVSSDTTTNR